MTKMKYNLNCLNEDFVLFPITVNHCDVKGNWSSAGFVTFTHERDEYGTTWTKANCFGRSDSLNLSSDEKDSSIISNYLNNWF